MPKAIELLPCPFCGSTATLYHTNDNHHSPKVLKQAREALCKGISELKVHCKYFDQTPEEDACIEMHEAVVEIDKAIGGGDVDKG